MVILDKTNEPKVVREFEAEVIILHHATTIKPKYQAVVHEGVVRQTAQVVSIKEKELLRTGDRGQVLFRFINSPEYIHPGANILFREGRTRGLGQITKCFYEENKKDKKRDHKEKDKEIPKDTTTKDVQKEKEKNDLTKELNKTKK